MSATRSRATLGSARALAALLSPAGRRGRLAVFCYHQVLPHADPLRPGEPDVAEFENDLEVIGRVFAVLPIADAARRLAAGRLPARAACITFDDGYANNQELAAPLLEKAGLPATFFVAGGAVDEGVMWNDLVIEAIARRRASLRVAHLPGLDDLDVAHLSDTELVPQALGRLKYRSMRERRETAERIYRDNVGADLPRLMMTRSMVADLARRGFDVGGHTINHPILQVLPAVEARAEIGGCKDWVREVTGQAPAAFAYPNGKHGKDFNEEHCAMVAEAGFELAVTTDWSIARPLTDAFNVPRIGPWWRSGRALATGLARAYVGSYRRSG